jgi:hypothetical protein
MGSKLKLEAAITLQPHIGILNESTIHAQLKELYLVPGASSEARIGSYFVDVLLPDNGIVEIQTGSFAKIQHKLMHLLEDRAVRLVFPLAAEKKIVMLDPDLKQVLSSRKSPLKKTVYDAAWELVHISKVLSHPRFSLEIIFTREEEIRRKDGKGSRWRKGISIMDRQLKAVIGRIRFDKPDDYASVFLSQELPDRFTNRALAEIISVPLSTARQITYFLRSLDVIKVVEKQGKELIFSR